MLFFSYCLSFITLHESYQKILYIKKNKSANICKTKNICTYITNRQQLKKSFSSDLNFGGNPQIGSEPESSFVNICF